MYPPAGERTAYINISLRVQSSSRDLYDINQKVCLVFSLYPISLFYG